MNLFGWEWVCVTILAGSGWLWAIMTFFAWMCVVVCQCDIFWLGWGGSK